MSAQQQQVLLNSMSTIQSDQYPMPNVPMPPSQIPTMMPQASQMMQNMQPTSMPVSQAPQTMMNAMPSTSMDNQTFAPTMTTAAAMNSPQFNSPQPMMPNQIDSKQTAWQMHQYQLNNHALTLASQIQNSTTKSKEITLVSMNEELQQFDYNATIKEYVERQNLQQIHDEALNVNLLDKESLDDLFINADGFTSTEYVFSLLKSLYENKYKDLYADQDLKNYFDLALSMLLYKGYKYMSIQAKEGGSHVVVQLNPITFLKRKAPDSDSEPQPKVAKPTVEHPLFNHEPFKSNAHLLKLGKIIEIYTPPSFALLKAKFSIQNITRIQKDNNKSNVVGLNIDIQPPLLISISLNKEASFEFYDAAPIAGMSHLFAAMGCKVYNRWLSYGKKKALSLVNVNQVSSTSSTDLVKFTSVFNIAIAVTQENIITGKCYSNTMHVLDVSALKVNETLLQSIMQAIDANLAGREAALKEYEKALLQP